MPRDRDGTFEPQTVDRCHHCHKADEHRRRLDIVILSLYNKGLSYEDIRAHLADMYGLEVSTGQLSAITDKILPFVEAWRSRPLEKVYALY